MKLVVLSLFLVGLAYANSKEDWHPASLFFSSAIVAPKSGPMDSFISLLREEGELGAPKKWQRIAELPGWVRDPKKREIVIIPGRLHFPHDYRYAVVVRKDGQVLLIRAGGMDDSYQFFRRLENRAQPGDQHNAGDRPPMNDTPAPGTSSSLAPRG